MELMVSYQKIDELIQCSRHHIFVVALLFGFLFPSLQTFISSYDLH